MTDQATAPEAAPIREPQAAALRVRVAARVEAFLEHEGRTGALAAKVKARKWGRRR